MRVGIIGCGPSGLNAIRCCLAEGYEVTAFEQNPDVGGEWYSTGEIGKDKYGVDVHSKIYEGLVTNVPKEAMAYSDFPFEKYKSSFLPQKDILEYFQSYANAFKLYPHIKFNHQVIQTRPLINDQWEIIAKDLPRNECTTHIFDVLFICVGIAVPLIPKIEGQEKFKGQILHSRDYRNATMFKNKKVLLIGSGTSALDMVISIGKVAEKLAWVHQFKEKHGVSLVLQLPESVSEMPSVDRFTENGAEFSDQTYEDFDIIAFATGYDLSFPFLSVDSGLYVREKCVYPLYKQCININKPTMAIIGIPSFAIRIPLFELQVKFCIEFLSGRKALPCKYDMLAEIEDFARERRSSDPNFHRSHYLGVSSYESYCRELAECAGIEPLKPVFAKIFNQTFELLTKNYFSFRNYKFKILNDNEFECSYEKSK